MNQPAIQIKGPGEVEVVGSVVQFYIGDKVVVSLDTSDERYDTMNKICGTIQFNPLVALACGLTQEPHEHVEPLAELVDHQSYLVMALRDDASRKLVDMERISCSGDMGITLEIDL